MKKLIKNGLLIVFFTVGCFLPTMESSAQQTQENSNPALFKAVYEFIHVDDSTQRDRPRQEEMILYMNSSSSMYRRASEEEGEYHRHLQSGQSKDTYDLNRILDRTASLYQHVGDNQLINTERIFQEMYQISHPLEHLSWDIQEETGEIEGYMVQLAIAHFAGRTYQAWFAAELPFPFGPWKLRGLPGLVLEARDTKDDVIFKLKSLESMEGQTVHITAPEGIRKVTASEFARIYQAFMDNPQAFAKATAPQGTIVAFGGASRSTVGASVKEKVYNNPIELEITQ